MFSPGTPVSSTNKIDRHDISEILIENAIKQHKPNQPTLLQVNDKLYHIMLCTSPEPGSNSQCQWDRH
jgi:hypothetical protein